MSARFAVLTAKEAAERLLSVKHPLILTHRNPDGDTVGTAVALMAFYRSIGREPCYASEGELPERLAFIAEGYTRALPPFDGWTPIAVDVASPAQLGTLVSQLPTETVALSIDHHAVSTPYADTFCLPDVSSAGEVLYHVLQQPTVQAIAPMTAEVARGLYTAICSDTGGFRFSNTSAETHRTVAELLAFPFDAADICHRLFSAKSEAQLRAEGLTAARMLHSGSIAYAVIDRASREAVGLSFEDFDCAIDVVRSLRGCKIAFIVKETDDGISKISLRSTGADVAAVAAAFGGGGHIRAAGCSLDEPVQKAAARVLSRLREVAL